MYLLESAWARRKSVRPFIMVVANSSLTTFSADLQRKNPTLRTSEDKNGFFGNISLRCSVSIETRALLLEAMKESVGDNEESNASFILSPENLSNSGVFRIIYWSLYFEIIRNVGSVPRNMVWVGLRK